MISPKFDSLKFIQMPSWPATTQASESCPPSRPARKGPSERATEQPPQAGPPRIRHPRAPDATRVLWGLFSGGPPAAQQLAGLLSSRGRLQLFLVPCCLLTSVHSCPDHPPSPGPHLDHLGHVALGPCVVRLILHTDQHNEVQVVPHVVLKLDVLLK